MKPTLQSKNKLTHVYVQFENFWVCGELVDEAEEDNYFVIKRLFFCGSQ